MFETEFTLARVTSRAVVTRGVLTAFGYEHTSCSPVHCGLTDGDLRALVHVLAVSLIERAKADVAFAGEGALCVDAVRV